VASPPSPQAGSAFQAVGATSVGIRYEGDSYAAASEFNTVRTDGNLGSPTTIQSGDELGAFDASGYDGSAVVGPRAAVRMYATQNWTTSAQGAYVDIATTPNGATTEIEVAKFNQDGGVTLSTTTDEGSGTLDATGLYVSGVAVPTTAIFSTANTWSAVQTYNNSDLALLGSSTGATTFTSANGSGTNYTLTIPAATDTLALLGASQTLANKTLSGVTVTAGDPIAYSSGASLCDNGSGGIRIGTSSGCNGDGTLYAATVYATSGFSANGTAGVTSTTCTQWTDGLCTHD
jgi:hypothetical protein